MILPCCVVDRVGLGLAAMVALTAHMHARAACRATQAEQAAPTEQAAPAEASAPTIQGEMSGYMLVPLERVPDEFNAGFSLYAAAWPLVERYPGSNFQTGLFGTWMFAQYERARWQARPERQAGDDVLRHRGRAWLVARHALCDDRAQVHHGRRGA